MSCIAKRTRSHTQKPMVAKRLKVDLKEKCSTTILILNNDCLEEVFLYLSRNDLINLYATNSRLRCACESTFARKYGKIPTIVSNIQGNRVNVQVIKSSIKLLEAFGHLMTKILIEFRLERIESLLEAIDNHCGDKINELELRHIGVRVKEPSIVYGAGLQTLDAFLSRISEKFPNLHSLIFDYRNAFKLCPYLKSIARPIPSLTRLNIVGTLYPLDDIHTVINSNGQLERLTLIGEPNGFIENRRTFYLTEDFIECLDKSLPQLKHLEINGVSIKYIDVLAEYLNRFENLESLTFGTFSTTSQPERGYLSFLGRNIEDLTLFTFDFLITTFAENLSRFKKLKRLHLHLTSTMELKGYMYFYIHSNQPDVLFVWSSHGLRKLISSNDQLQEIVIQRYRHTDENYFDVAYGNMERDYLDCVKSKINGAQWNMKIVGKCYVFTKAIQNYKPFCG